MKTLAHVDVLRKLASNRTARGFLSLLTALTLTSSCTRESDPENTAASALVRYPLALDKQCRDGKAQLYDECSDQLVLFNNALERANAEGKVLLVSYGAEWCIWCHVLDAHLLGGKRTFRYTYGTAENPSERFSDTIYEHDDADGVNAEALRNFVTNEFVIVHIDCQYAPNGENVLTQTAAAEFAGNWIPFVFVVDKAGHYVASLDHSRVEKRRDTTDWYRGYNRTKLIEQLTRMRNQART